MTAVLARAPTFHANDNTPHAARPLMIGLTGKRNVSTVANLLKEEFGFEKVHALIRLSRRSSMAAK